MRGAGPECDVRVLRRNIVGFEQHVDPARSQSTKDEASGGIGRRASAATAHVNVRERLARRSIQDTAGEDRES